MVIFPPGTACTPPHNVALRCFNLNFMHKVLIESPSKTFFHPKY
jgi:hypothetical protein